MLGFSVDFHIVTVGVHSYDYLFYSAERVLEKKHGDIKVVNTPVHDNIKKYFNAKCPLLSRDYNSSHPQPQLLQD